MGCGGGTWPWLSPGLSLERQSSPESRRARLPPAPKGHRAVATCPLCHPAPCQSEQPGCVLPSPHSEGQRHAACTGRSARLSRHRPTLSMVATCLASASEPVLTPECKRGASDGRGWGFRAPSQSHRSPPRPTLGPGRVAPPGEGSALPPSTAPAVTWPCPRLRVHPSAGPKPLHSSAALATCTSADSPQPISKRGTGGRGWADA